MVARTTILEIDPIGSGFWSLEKNTLIVAVVSWNLRFDDTLLSGPLRLHLDRIARATQNASKRSLFTHSTKDHDKARIANGILTYVQEELKGRFLNIDSKTKSWYVLPNSVVLDKIKQALRDKYIPYWARDLQIENMSKESSNSILTNTEGADASTTKTKRIPPMEFNRSDRIRHTMLPLPLPSSYGGVHHPQMLRQMNPSGANVSGVPSLAEAAATAAAVNDSAVGTRTTNHSVKNPKADVAAKNNLDFLFGASARRPMAVPMNPTDHSVTNAKANVAAKNKLDFLFGTSAIPPMSVPIMGRTSAIPSIDDILKCKVDQMPSFAGVSNAGLMAAAMANTPPRPSFGLNPFQSNLIPSFGMGSLGMASMSGHGVMLNDGMMPSHGGFGVRGNPGAPAFHSTAAISQSFHNMNMMRSLDKYVEERMAEKMMQSMGTQAFAAAQLSSMGRFNALAGTSFDSSTSASNNSVSAFPGVYPNPAAAAPTGPKKTDWNAMYTMALTPK